MLLAMALLMWRAIPYFRTMQGQIDRVHQILREQISGLRVIRAFIAQPAVQILDEATSSVDTRTDAWCSRRSPSCAQPHRSSLERT